MYKNYPFFNRPIKVVAHRGDSRYYPENSLPAFKSAVELGVDIIETDVHISSDGVIFVWHDDDTYKLDGDSTPIYKRSWTELKELDLGFIYIDKDGKRPFSSRGITLVTFDELLEKFPDSRFNVDLKDKKPELVKGFYNILEKNNAFERVVVASFHTENLKQMRKISNRVVTSYGHSEVLHRVVMDKFNTFRFFSRFIAMHPVIQVPVSQGSTTIVTKRFIKILHKRGVKIQVWTINSADEMRMLLKMGVDGIMTDDPRLLLSVIKEKG